MAEDEAAREAELAELAALKLAIRAFMATDEFTELDSHTKEDMVLVYEGVDELKRAGGSGQKEGVRSRCPQGLQCLVLRAHCLCAVYPLVKTWPSCSTFVSPVKKIKSVVSLRKTHR